MTVWLEIGGRKRRVEVPAGGGVMECVVDGRSVAVDARVLQAGGMDYHVGYEPGESRTWLFGGNSNWRGPVWLPMNYLLIEALERYHHFYGDTFTMEFPTGSGRRLNLAEIARELGQRLVGLFVPNGGGRRPAMGMEARFVSDQHWQELLWSHEYFHGDTGQGPGANHQTGWAALVARLFTHLSR